MRTPVAFVLSLFLVGLNEYKGPISGDVRNPTFSFSHTSDWSTNQIANTLQNDHTQPLVVFWPEGGITAPEERPIPPKKSDSNRSFCPEDALTANYGAQLFYGLSHTPKVAGVYKMAQQAAQQPDRQVIGSNIVASTPAEPITFKVTSTAVPNEYVEYVFDQNRQNSFALAFQADYFKYFEAAKISSTVGAFQALNFGKLPVAERVPDFKNYVLFRPQGLNSVVRIPARSFQHRRLLTFLLDQQNRLLASGFVTLHVPAL